MLKKHRDEAEEDIKVMGIKTGWQWAETVRHAGRLCWKSRSTTDSRI
jgi:hypothetical protein